MRVVVLAGGYSPEREVSFSSGALITNALIENGHEVMLLDLYLGNENKDFPAVYTKEAVYSYQVQVAEPDLDKLKKLSSNGELIGPSVIELCQQADVVFIALHGSMGENGQLQAVFDLYNINYTGSVYIGCLLSMDKDIAKKLMRQNNILTPPGITAYKNVACNLENVTFPCVVKPCSNGSSIGVSFAENEAELKVAMDNAFKYEDKILIEQKIVGREFSAGILDNQALPIIEIIPKEGFYDYKNKYQKGASDEICPAAIEPELSAKIQSEALKIHHTLNLGFYSRMDFILDESDNCYWLEANSLPGMTQTSLLPQEAAAAGIDYNMLCEKICNAAVRNRA